MHLHPPTLYWPINDGRHWTFLDANPVLTVAPVTTRHQQRVVNLTQVRAWVVTPVRRSDYEQWAALFRAYARVHHVQPSPETIEAVWRRLHDRDDVLHGLVVRRTYTGAGWDGALSRSQIRPETGCFVDDLFVDPVPGAARLGRAGPLAAPRQGSGWGPAADGCRQSAASHGS